MRLYYSIFAIFVVLFSCFLAPKAQALTIVNHIGGGQVASGQAKNFTKACAAGEVLLGGGYAVTPDYGSDTIAYKPQMDRYFVYESFPSSTVAWTAGLWNRSSGSVNLIVYATCASGSNTGTPGIVTEGGGLGGPVTANCASGIPTGGGFRALADNHVRIVSIVASMPRGPGWQVIAKSVSTSGEVSVDAFAVCNPVVSTKVNPRVTMNVPPGAHVPPNNSTFTTGSNSVQLACTGVPRIAGVGFYKREAEAGAMVLTQLSPVLSPADHWQGKAFTFPEGGFEGPIASRGSVDFYPVCVAGIVHLGHHP